MGRLSPRIWPPIGLLSSGRVLLHRGRIPIDSGLYSRVYRAPEEAPQGQSSGHRQSPRRTREQPEVHCRTSCGNCEFACFPELLPAARIPCGVGCGGRRSLSPNPEALVAGLSAAVEHGSKLTIVWNTLERNVLRECRWCRARCAFACCCLRLSFSRLRLTGACSEKENGVKKHSAACSEAQFFRREHENDYGTTVGAEQ